MAIVNVYHQEDNRTYQVSFNLVTSVLDRVGGSPTDGSYDFYLTITTSMRDKNNNTFPSFVVRNLSDVPPGFSTAANFTQLVDYYIEYFIKQAQLTLSSSSSSSSTSQSSASSSSSSSFGITSSSSSNSSSSNSSSSNSSSSNSSSSNSSSNSSNSSSSLSSESSIP